MQQALAALGAQPVSGCTFDFGGALNDLPTMIATARVVENVGIGAYLGAAHLLDDPVLLTDAATILTVEARHQTVLNIFAGSGSSIPQAFDVGLTPSEVLAIAGPFIKGCDLGIPANPSLAVGPAGTLNTGAQLQLTSAAFPSDTSNLTCQLLKGGDTFAVAMPLSQCVVPPGIDGPVAVFVTNDTQPLAGNVRDRATNKLVAGPALAFIDSKQQALPQLARNLGGAQAPAGNSTAPSTDAAPAPNNAGSAPPPNVPAPNTMGGINTMTGPAGNGTVNVIGFSPVAASSVQ
jgi:hypothetical protein